MKRTVLRNWMVAAMLTGACCGMVGCDKDNDGSTEPDVTAVQGNFAGTMEIVEATPLADDENVGQAGIAVSATVAADKIQFEDFPVRDLIIKVVGDEQTADQILEQIGQVNYEVPYTAVMSDNHASIQLTLKPEPLKLTLTDNSGEGGSTKAGSEGEGDGNGDGEGSTETEVEITITSDAEGIYVVGTKELTFHLAATSVKLAGTEIPDFKPISLAFDLTKK